MRPTIATELVGIEYLAVPSQIVVATDNIEFPEAMEDLILNKTLNYISFKQGDNTTINSVTNADLNLLIKSVV